MLKDQANTHRRVPPHHVWGVGNFELDGDVLVEHAKTHSVDAGKREVVIIVAFEVLAGHFDCCFGGKVVLHREIARIGDKDERGSWLD